MSSQSDVPVFHYLALGRLGRGEVLNLFLKDAGVEFKEIRYPYDETWPAQKKKLQEEGITKTGLLPALEYKGSIYTQHIPTLRFLAREFGGYDGETSQEKYLVDAVADIYIDWRTQWVAALKGVTNEYKTEFLPNYYAQIAQYYSQNKGPYLLGDKITYVDFAVYQSIDNDMRIGSIPLPSKLPDELVQLIETINKRPNIAQYLEKNKFTPT